MKNRVLLIILAMMMYVLSAQTSIEPTGSGTVADPYQISSLGNLYWISSNPSSWIYQFVQTADIDAAETSGWFVGDHDNNSSTPEEAMGWFGIGNSSSKFAGCYDGQGHKISNLYLNRKFGTYWGLFRYIYKYSMGSDPNGVKNLELVNVNIKANDYVGGIAGNNEDSQIWNCKVSGTIEGHFSVGGIVGFTVRPDQTIASVYKCENAATITGSGDESNMIGGIAGQNGNSKMEKCRNIGLINGNSTYIGGLAGFNSTASIIKQCYNTGNLSSSYSGTVAGGICGWNNGSTIIDSYNKGNINITSYMNGVGGIAGNDQQGTITNCYNSGAITVASGTKMGGLVGGRYISHTNYCHWNSDTTLFNGFGESEPNSLDNGSSRLTSVEMYMGNFSNWDWISIWQSNTGDYPTLRDNIEQTLPVTLSSFSAICLSSETVSINWTSQSESNLLGYHIHRNTISSLSGADRMNSQLILAGNQSNEQNYNFTDSEVEMGNKYYYWLQSLECDGTSSYYGPVDIKVANPGIVVSVPGFSSIDSVYPNPVRANQSVNLKISVGQDEQGSLKIYNAKGQLVKSYMNLVSGDHQLVWNVKDEVGRLCSAGVYFYQLKSNSCLSTGKMLIIK